ncbi:hypothetical protein V501_03814 [Pseudogymnoascus sp. VKM F-4519 (FW-2642)]|nr:hypothetical protein V501_03814 [Pseudogymnoascus sp. VKM F-4519 (FW-2642)]
MSGRSKLSNSSSQVPRRSARHKTGEGTTPAPEFEAEGNAATHNVDTSSEPPQLEEKEDVTCEASAPKLEDNPHKQRPKRASKRPQTPKCHIDDPLDFITKATTKSDLDKWKGWCEVESEPAFFNVILRHLGVTGIKVQEVFSLDDEMLSFLPKPIHGLIFLFRFEEDDPAMQEATCPDNIWFANQTISNACATIALLNIAMNTRGVDLGPTLNSLKDFSMPLTPALRGYTVGNHDYLRKIHNSFSRKMDMLNSDLFLSNDVTSKAKLPGKTGKNVEQEQAGFHFISLVPIDGKLWKLDGLERQPMNLGEYVGDDWMDLARSIIEKRMQKYDGDQFEFSLLALCQSPLLAVHNDLAENIRTTSAVEGRLASFQPDWRGFVDSQCLEKTLSGPNGSYGITAQHLESVPASAPILQEIQTSTITTERLLDLWKQLSDSQAQMRASYIEEETAIQQDEERAATRCHDYTPMVNTWLAALADKNVLKSLINEASHGYDHE